MDGHAYFAPDTIVASDMVVMTDLIQECCKGALGHQVSVELGPGHHRCGFVYLATKRSWNILGARAHPDR